MRTTLTLDDDVAVELRRIQKQRSVGLKELVNDLLRTGLAARRAPRRRAPFRVEPMDLGRCLLENVDDVESVLAFAEGEQHR